MSAMAAHDGLIARGITHAFPGADGGTFIAVEDVSIQVRAGEFVTLVGPSGCGKSTVFNIIAGLIRPDVGEVLVGGEDVTGNTGHVGYMLQRDCLLPWRTVEYNVILPQQLQGVPLGTALREARAMLDRFGLGRWKETYPDSLSGGMRQRAAFIRTLLSKKDLLLLDEPLGALDAQTRLLMQEWLLDVWEQFQKTVFLITHDIDEAIFLSDRIYVMSARPGRVLEEIRVDLARPRQASVRTETHYNGIRARVLELIRAESIRALDMAQGG